MVLMVSEIGLNSRGNFNGKLMDDAPILIKNSRIHRHPGIEFSQCLMVKVNERLF